MRIATPLALAASLLATSAFAQGPGFLGLGGSDQPFNGPYIGAQAGWQLDRQYLNSTYPSNVPDGIGTFGVGAHPRNSGFRYGGQIGWDVHVAPRIVIGVEGSASGVTGANYGSYSDGNPLVFSVGRTFDATGRVGFLVDPQGLLYAKGGWTNTEFHFDNNDGRFVSRRDGYIVGAGYEHMIGRHLSAGLEYDYSHFGNRDFPNYDFETGALNSRIADDRHEVLAKVNYRF